MVDLIVRQHPTTRLSPYFILYISGPNIVMERRSLAIEYTENIGRFHEKN